MQVKYPRTPHLPYSLGCTDDDKKLESDFHFYDCKEIIVTEKLDGENWSGYSDGTSHARSVDGLTCIWQTWTKNFWHKKHFDLPKNWRVCAESMYATHSIRYENLDSYLYVISIWNEDNCCLSWDETRFWAELLELHCVPEIYRGPYDNKIVMRAFEEYSRGREVEGFVVRNSESFHYNEFEKNVAKFVRHNHVKTDEHWTRAWSFGGARINKLKEIKSS